MGKKHRNVLFAPWIGEFGWELIWQGRCRRIAEQYKYAFVLSNELNHYLYSDFASLIPYPGLGYIKEKNGIYGQEYMMDSVSYSNSLSLLLGDCDLITPRSEFSPFSFSYQISDKEKFISYGEVQAEDYICIHARNRQSIAGRNWGVGNWSHLVSMLKRKGRRVIAIGGQDSLCPDGAEDFLGLNTRETISIIKKSKVMLGESSGPMHLAMLVETPIIVWWTGETDNIKKTRYERLWNFHDSSVKTIGDFGIEVTPSNIMDAVEKYQ